MAEGFLGTDHWLKSGATNNIMHSIVSFCKWAILNDGGYANIAIDGVDNIRGGNNATLHPYSGPNFPTAGQVWQANRANWVWETGVTYTPNPVVASGVEVDGTFYPTATTTGTYEHYIDFPHGMVHFTSPISTTSTVKTSYSTRAVDFIDSDTPWFKHLLFNSRDTSSTRLNDGSGDYGRARDRRIQLPAVGVELSNRQQNKPFALGGGQWTYQDVIFHVLCEDRYTQRQIIDLLSDMNDHTIKGIDLGVVRSSGYIELDYRGAPVDSPVQYEEQTADGSPYRWGNMKFTNLTVTHSPPRPDHLYHSAVRMTVEVIRTNI